MKEKTVLITGATGGLGKEFASYFAQEGCELVLTGRNIEKLIDLKKKLQENHQIKIWIVAIDFATEPYSKLFEYIEENCGKIDVVVNNAGFGYVGEFYKCDKQVMEDMITVNIRWVNGISYYYANQMKERGEGAILNIASTGAYHPGPYTAVYYATKAYVASLSEALAYEMRPYGVKVFSICPGAVDTDFSRRAGRRDNPVAMDPKSVVRKTMKKVKRKNATIIPGIIYWWFVKIPRKIAAPLIARQQKNMAYHIDK